MPKNERTEWTNERTRPKARTDQAYSTLTT
jgi:hypothetical protein